MNSNFIKITEREYNLLIKNADANSIFIAEIDGKLINNLSKYLYIVWDVFKFPKTETY